MITMERAAELLTAYDKNEEHISDVRVVDDQYVSADLSNALSPSQPFRLIVHPVKETLMLKIRVPNIAKIRMDSAIVRVIANRNYQLVFGCIGIDRDDGEVMIEINHAVVDGEVQDPPPELFTRLLDAVRETVTDVSRTILHVGMIEAGIPEDLAAKIMETQFPLKGGQDNEPTL